MSGRALRRHHRARIRRRALRILNQFQWGERPLKIDDPWVYRRANNYTVCSCWMCGNVRRLKGGNGPERTRQEHLAELNLREQITDLG